MKSRKITNQDRVNLYHKFIELNSQNTERSKEIEDNLSNLIKERIYKKYLKKISDREFIENKKNSSFILYTFFCIELSEEYKSTYSEEDIANYPYSYFSIVLKEMPRIVPDTFCIDEFLKKEGIYDSVMLMVKENTDLLLEDIKKVEKYIPKEYRPFYSQKNHFCEGITTSLQLKNKCPEIYKIYKEEKCREIDLKELKRDLGF